MTLPAEWVALLNMNLGVVLGCLVVAIVIVVVYYHYHPSEWSPIKLWFEGVYDYWINNRFFAKPT